MSFNPNARINTRNVSKRTGGGGSGLKIGGGSIGVVFVLFLASQFLGIDLMPFAGVATDVVSGSGSSQSSSQLANCETGADANANDECRMAGAADSLDKYWSDQVSNYRSPQLVLFEGRTVSQCGTADASTGPFYCPPEEGIYMDTSFFGTLSRDYGSSSGPLAQMYVLAHEWGHHISNLIGQMDLADRGSGADSGSVRLELQADCFAGAWVQNATETYDENGVPLLQPITKAQLQDALSAAAAVGDDHIMESAGMKVNPERFTHGSSEQRQRWFETGFEEGPTACSTFDVPAGSL